jgi:hypothetical protein
MEDLWLRLVEHLDNRVNGPMSFRFYLQPVMAIFFAVRSGLNDAKIGKTPYFWGLLSDPEHRVEMLKDGWKSVGKVFILAIILDVIFQIMFLKSFFPLETLAIAFFLAIVPYVAIRGLVTRIARK